MGNHSSSVNTFVNRVASPVKSVTTEGALLSFSQGRKICRKMPLSSFSTAVTVFLTTWLSGPLIYSLDKLAAMEDERWIFVAGVIVLPCFGLMTYVFARKTQAMAESDQPLFYGKQA